MRRPQPNRDCLKDEQYLSSVALRIQLKLDFVTRNLGDGNLAVAAALLMAINDDTADIAAALEQEHPKSEA